MLFSNLQQYKIGSFYRQRSDKTKIGVLENTVGYYDMTYCIMTCFFDDKKRGFKGPFTRTEPIINWSANWEPATAFDVAKAKKKGYLKL